MPYTPFGDWVDNTSPGITASRLTTMEAGIAAAMPVTAQAILTSGVMAPSTSYTAVKTDGSIDITVAAATGDVVMVGVSGRSTNEAGYLFLDAASMVSGSPVNYISGGTGSSEGVQAWQMNNLSTDYRGFGGSVLYTLASGDISSGNLTLRLFFKYATTARGFALSSNDPLHFWVVNLHH